MKIEIFDPEEMNHQVFKLFFSKIDEKEISYSLCIVSSRFDNHDLSFENYRNLPGVRFAMRKARECNSIVILHDSTCIGIEDKRKLETYVQEAMNLVVVYLPISCVELLEAFYSTIERLS